MLATTPTPILNSLLAGLPGRSRDRILKRCESVDLTFGDILCEPGKPYRFVYFPLSGGFISLVATASGHAPLEMGMIGNEGMLGVTMVLGISCAPLRGVVQGPGPALRMPAATLRSELRDNLPLLRTLHRYLYVLTAQLSQTAICTRFHEIEERLSRWLLMTHDRAHSDQFHLTHTFLAGMLGVQRSAVTIAAGKLQRKRILRYTRGEITILDRKALEATSCECYQASIEDYGQLFNQKPFGEKTPSRATSSRSTPRFFVNSQSLQA